jgi:hypothetical protein
MRSGGIVLLGAACVALAGEYALPTASAFLTPTWLMARLAAFIRSAMTR